LFGEGAAAASLIPVYSRELQKDSKKAASLANTVVTVVFVILSIIVILGWIGIAAYYFFFRPDNETSLILSLTSVMLPYMLLICTVAILAGILHVHGHFATPAMAPIVLNIFIISAVIITSSLLKVSQSQRLFIVAYAVLIAGLVQIAIQIIPLRANSVIIRPAWQVRSEAFKKILLMMGPMILGLTATQINTLFDDVIAWWFSGSVEKGDVFTFLGHTIAYPLRRGSVSHLNAAQRLYQMPLGVFGISLATAIFPVMSARAAGEDIGGLRKTISDGFKSAIFIGTPATVGMLLVAGALVSAAFQHGKFDAADTRATTMTLVFYSLGLNGYFIQQIVTRAFYSIHEPKVPMHSAMIAVCANIILNLSLIWVWGTGGLACSTAICSYLQVTILTLSLRRRLGASILHGIPWAAVRTFAATAIMGIAGIAILYFCRNFPEGFRYNILRLALLVPTAGTVYLLTAKLMNIEMLSLLTGRRRR
jgi:putative peptidoglycan lipid II flippase